jgi:hypothetical protein
VLHRSRVAVGSIGRRDDDGSLVLENDVPAVGVSTWSPDWVVFCRGNLQSVDDTGNVTQDGQQDVDEEIGIATALKLGDLSAGCSQVMRCLVALTKTPRGGRMMARMILQMSLAVKGMIADDAVVFTRVCGCSCDGEV